MHVPHARDSCTSYATENTDYLTAVGADNIYERNDWPILLVALEGTCDVEKYFAMVSAAMFFSSSYIVTSMSVRLGVLQYVASHDHTF